MKTAVEYLAYVYALQGAIYQDDIDKAIEIEKEQVIKAYEGGETVQFEDAEQYYNETFKQQEQ
jgi:hypothetical protein